MATWRTVNTRKVAYLESIGADVSQVIDEGGWSENGYLIGGAHQDRGYVSGNSEHMNTRIPWPDRDAAWAAYDGDYLEATGQDVGGV